MHLCGCMKLVCTLKNYSEEGSFTGRFERKDKLSTANELTYLEPHITSTTCTYNSNKWLLIQPFITLLIYTVAVYLTSNSQYSFSSRYKNNKSMYWQVAKALM